MVKAIQKKLSESKTARWTVLALVSFTMMCAYFISDIMWARSGEESSFRIQENSKRSSS